MVGALHGLEVSHFFLRLSCIVLVCCCLKIAQCSACEASGSAIDMQHFGYTVYKFTK